MIRTELAWLEHLAATTSIIAPRPVPTRAGHPFVFARSPGVPDGRIISALRFVHGRLVGAKSSRKLAGSIGALAADLHVSTASRPELGSGVPPAHGLYTMIPRIWADLPPTLLTSRRRAILLAAEARIGACLESLATGDSVRLCHLDLHPHNLVRTPSGQLAPIDFDDCARAHPALDLGIALHYLRAHAPDAPLPVLCDELLAGYATRSTPPADSATVRTLADARQLMLLNQLCSETNPTLAAKLPDYVELAVRRLSIDA
jgi:Ser/Thr protein kinase RdoA (MazF antagonist)